MYRVIGQPFTSLDPSGMKTVHSHALIRHRSTFFGLIGTALIASIVVCPGCSSDKDGHGKNGATASEMEDGCILVIAVDGLEWNLALSLIQANRMPNLEHLMKRGTYGKIETYAPAKSPVIWTTIATGKTPDKHGILDFVKPGKNRKPILYNSRDRRTKALWNILTDADRTMTVIGWWNTFPVEAINGTIVAQTNTRSQIEERILDKGGLVRGVNGQVYPPDRQNEMLEVFACVSEELPTLVNRIYGDMGTIHFEPNRINWERCRWAFRADEAYRRIALKLARERPLPDLFAVYFGSPDVVGHRFWRFHKPRSFKHPPKPIPQRRFGEVVRNTYVHFDNTLGELIAAFPNNTNVFVMSDHGMHAENMNKQFDVFGDRGGICLESGAHKDGPPGLFAAAGPYIKKTILTKPIQELSKDDLPTVGSVVDFTPTLLALLSIPIGRDMEGVVLDRILRPEIVSSLDVKSVETHDTSEWFASRGKSPVKSPGTDERIRQLRSLGYLGDSEEQVESESRANTENRVSDD